MCLELLRELLLSLSNARETYKFEVEAIQELAGAFRALMSDPELHFLLYWGLSERSNSECHRLIDKCFLLEGLIDKPAFTITGRVPELAYYKETYAKWSKRHGGDRIPGDTDAVVSFVKEDFGT